MAQILSTIRTYPRTFVLLALLLDAGIIVGGCKLYNDYNYPKILLTEEVELSDTGPTALACLYNPQGNTLTCSSFMGVVNRLFGGLFNIK